MKAITPVVTLILLIIIIISVTTLSMTIFFSSVKSTGIAAQQQITITSSRLANCLRLDNIKGNDLFIRNCGSNDFNGSMRVYVNNTQSCVSTNMQNYTIDLNVSIPKNAIQHVNIGCCVPEGTSNVRITTSGFVTMAGRIEDYRFSQQLFFDWEETEVVNISRPYFKDHAFCSGPQDCTIPEANRSLLVANVSIIAEQLAWNATNNTQDSWYHQCDDEQFCDNSSIKLYRTRFYYNPAAFHDREVWFVDNANFGGCTLGGKKGIIVNEDIYFILNNNLVGWGGRTYFSPFVNYDAGGGPWCIPPIEASDPAFAQECGMNNITVAVENIVETGRLGEFYLDAG